MPIRFCSNNLVWRVSLISLISALSWSPSVFAQDALPPAELIDEDDLRAGLEQAPAPQVGVTTLDQEFRLNNDNLVFENGYYADLPFEFGTDRTNVFRGSLTAVRDAETSQALDLSPQGARVTQTQSATVLQLRAIDQKRVTTRQIDERGDLIGFRLDFSVTGKCFLPGTNPDEYCTYTPGLATADGFVDPDTLSPSGFLASSEFGQVIPQATHESLFAPGFQRGADVMGGPLVGLSFDVLNSGFVNEAGPDAVSGSRHEETDLRLVPSFARVTQTLTANSNQAVAARTTRAFVLPAEREIDEAYILMQLATAFLPEAKAEVPYTESPPNGNISNNLFLSLSNARVPANSFTMFETGRVKVATSASPARSAAETPVARYGGVWMGLSPVRDVSVSGRVQFIPTGQRNSVGDPTFAEGGIGTPFADIIDAGITLIDEIDQSVTDVNLQGIDDVYIQLGLDLTRQAGIRRITNVETSDYRLVPHLSFNGNRTGGEHVLRYYTGVILNDEPNVYIGSDFTLATEDGWNANARLDLYSEDDPDYRSELALRGSRTVTLSPDRGFTLGAGGTIELDTDAIRNGDNPMDDEDRVADVFARWQEGPFNFSINERFSRDEPGDWGQSTIFGIGYAQDNNFSFSAQYTPSSSETSYVEAAVGVNVRLQDLAGQPVLQAQLAQLRNDVGVSTTGFRVSDTEQVFRAGLEMRF